MDKRIVVALWVVIAMPALAAIVCGCASADSEPPTLPKPPALQSAQFDASFEREPIDPDDVFALAGKNADEIRRFLAGYPSGSERRPAAQFLTDNLCAADAISMSRDDLRENLEYAFMAKETFPWAQGISDRVFLQYVLPHRVAHEPFTPMRKQLYEEMLDALAGVSDLRTACRIVNEWCLSKAGFKPSARFDQHAAATIARGFGRCEELAILYVAAARAAGIPARTCMAVGWRHTNDNHLWIEVWDGKNWRYIGAGEPESDFDSAWFTPNLGSTGFFIAKAFGSPLGEPLGDDIVHRFGRGYTLINRTPAYAPTGTLQVSVIDAGGEPVEGAKAFGHIFNSGGLWPTARFDSDETGRDEKRMGVGSYLLIAAKDNATDHAVVEVGRDAETLVVLQLKDREPPQGSFRLRWPLDIEERDRLQAAYDAAKAQAAQRLKPLEESRSRRFELLGKTIDRAAGSNQGPLHDVLTTAGFNAPQLIEALSRVDGERRNALIGLIGELHPKDRLTATADGLLDGLEYAMIARANAADEKQLFYDDDLFRRYVLSERLLHENFSHWRKTLATRFAPSLRSGGLYGSIAAINEFAASLTLLQEENPLAPGLTPLQALHGEYVTSDQDRAVFAAAALRSIGIPARLANDNDFIDVFNGFRWTPFFADNPEDYGETTKTTEARGWFGDPAEVTIAFTKAGRPVSRNSLRYYGDFTLNRFSEKGTFVTMENLRLKAVEGSDNVIVDIPSGVAFIIAGVRDKPGETLALVKRIETVPGQSLRVEMALDYPPDEPDEAPDL